MCTRSKWGVWIAVCAGCLLGLSLGLTGDRWVAPLCLIAVLWPLAEKGVSPAQAARMLGAFASALLAAGHAGVLSGVPSGLEVMAFVPLAGLVVAYGLCAAVLGHAAFFACRSPIARVALVVPSLWALLEWMFSLSSLAVPWIRLGYSQAAGGLFASAFALGGVLLVGWLMFCTCGAVVLLCRVQGLKAKRNLAGLALLVSCASLYLSTIAWTQPSGSLNVDLIQSGVPTNAKFGDAAIGELLAFHDAALRNSRADLMVASQLAIPKTPGALPEGYLSGIQGNLHRRGADALIGMYVDADTPSAVFNGVQSLGRSGPQHYLKHHLFPFGEALPAAYWALPWTPSAVPAAGSVVRTQPGPMPTTPLQLGAHRAALAICFEAAFGNTWRAQAATADLLINVSSDSAIDSRQIHRQFRRIVQARALEFQKPVIRTSDVRGSYFVDAAGQMTGELPDGARAVGHGVVEGRRGLTPYARFGDALPLLVAALGWCAAWLLGRATPQSVISVGGTPVGRVQPRSIAAQSGQVMPVATVLLLIVAGMFYLMVNAGQSVTEKIRVTNAADAAAYSAAVVEARALNYDAYLNRAMVANEIAIAQMVSFASWVNYFASAADHIGESAADMNFFMLPNPQVAVLDVAFGGSAFAAAYYGGRTVKEYADYIVDGAGAVIAVHDISVQWLSASQQLVHANLAFGLRQRQIANRVVEAMDPTLRAEVVLASHDFDSFTKNYARDGESGDERGRFAAVTMDSRDPFTRERNWTAKSFGIPLVRRDPALKKRGGTELRGFDEWRAVDTLELHGRRFGCGSFGTRWCDDIRRPIGWGAVEVDAGGGDVGAGYHGNAYGENGNTAGRADADMESPRFARFSGLPDTRDLSDLDPTHEAVTGITICVSKAQSDTLTSGNAAQAQPSGELALFNAHPAGGQLMALSRAQVFFDRIAARADGKEEIGSLYNPYWRVRLVAPTAVDRAYAAGRQEGLALP